MDILTPNPHPFAITLGKIVSETCQGINSNYSLSVLDPFNPGQALVGAQGDIPANCYGDALQFVNDTVALYRNVHLILDAHSFYTEILTLTLSGWTERAPPPPMVSNPASALYLE